MSESFSVYVVLVYYCVFFFFKQKTAYEMRISDWSSDVCSSDLTDGKTAAGVQYVQPKDWTATTRGPAVLFVSPEKDLRAVVVDVGAAADGAAAAAKAW